MKDLGMDCHLLQIIIEMYQDNKAQIKRGSKLSEPINVTKGLRQGCSMSPILFNLYVEVALRNWKNNCRGMGLTVNDVQIFSLSFADDQAVIAQDDYDLEFMIRRLYQEYDRWGLQMSLTKTEYLVVNGDTKVEVHIDDNAAVRQVKKFKYLGAYIDKNGLGHTEIKHRIQQSRKVLGCMNSFW